MHGQAHEAALAIDEDAQEGRHRVGRRAGLHREAGIGLVGQSAVENEPDAARPLAHQGPAIGQEDERPGRFQIRDPGFEAVAGRLGNEPLADRSRRRPDDGVGDTEIAAADQEEGHDRAGCRHRADNAHVNCPQPPDHAAAELGQESIKPAARTRLCRRGFTSNHLNPILLEICNMRRPLSAEGSIRLGKGLTPFRSVSTRSTPPLCSTSFRRSGPICCVGLPVVWQQPQSATFAELFQITWLDHHECKIESPSLFDGWRKRGSRCLVE
jgi:hypothetical protein